MESELESRESNYLKVMNCINQRGKVYYSDWKSITSRFNSYVLPSKEEVDFIQLQHVYYNPSTSTLFVLSVEEEDQLNCKNRVR